MPLQAKVGLILVVLGGICGALMMLVTQLMIDRLNERLPPDRQLQCIYGRHVRTRIVARLYREYYPEGRLYTLQLLLLVACLVLGGIGAWLFAFVS